MSTRDMTRAKVIRGAVISNPEVSTRKLKGVVERAGGKAPKDEQRLQQLLYQSRSVLRERWDVEDLQDLPRNDNGRLDIVAMAVMYREWFPDDDFKHAARYFANDGLRLTQRAWDLSEKAAGESPDPNQHTGPRAGKRGSKRSQTPTADAGYEDLEARLDGMIREADNLGNSVLVQKLRDARREASAAVLGR